MQAEIMHIFAMQMHISVHSEKFTAKMSRLAIHADLSTNSSSDAEATPAKNFGSLYLCSYRMSFRGSHATR